MGGARGPLSSMQHAPHPEMHRHCPRHASDAGPDGLPAPAPGGPVLWAAHAPPLLRRVRAGDAPLAPPPFPEGCREPQRGRLALQTWPLAHKPWEAM